MLRRGEKRLRPVHANAGLAAAYRAQLDKLIAQMAESYYLRLRGQYRRDPPAMAQDEKPKRVTAVQNALGELSDVWTVVVDGAPLRTAKGVVRTFRSQAAAEDAGLRSAGVLGLLTKPSKARDRTPLEELPLAFTPAEGLEELLNGMGARWAERFEAVAPKLATYYAGEARKQGEQSLRSILRNGGVTVRMPPMTPELRDIMSATVAEGVAMIKSIQQDYHTQVAGLVMRSVTRGRDLGYLTKELEKRYAITRKRSALIALHQNNMATAAIQQERQTAVGIEEGIWKHSHAGKTPRPTHLANDGKRFNLRTGWYDPDPKVRRNILPAELINCRCFWIPVVKGFTAEAA